METASFHDMLSVSWRPRRASAVVLAEAQRPKNQGVNGINFSISTKVGEPEAPMSKDKRI
jgi:hypothetical protein